MPKGRRANKNLANEVLKYISGEDGKRMINEFRRQPKKEKENILRLLKTKRYKTRNDLILLDYGKYL
tara:strand:+ start:660 stop:860 length:201 start_codon:yes stop_codon:yes gene_type:complete